MTSLLRNVMILVVMTGGFFPFAQASALTPPPAPEKAKVVFSNGGRILSMNADGTDRTVIFGKKRPPLNDELGAVEPDVSPNGKTVVFAFRREAGGDPLIDVWRVGIDGTSPRRFLISKPGYRYGDPVFAPNGRVVVAFFRTGKGSYSAGLLSIDPSNGNRKFLLTRKEKRRPYMAPTSIMEPAVSPDGRKALYLDNSGFSGEYFDDGFANPLMVLNLSTGRSKVVAEGAYDAAWSPDGRKIVFSAQTSDDDLEICWWETDCGFQSSLSVINADGSGQRSLTGKKLDERSPDWSADNRIVFQSARNMPEAGEANEIYSVRPNGKCLTMLTNGSPASLTPAWAGSEDSSSAPRGCGSMPPDSGVEVRVPARLANALWFGDSFDSRVLSNFSAYETGGFFLYLDCDRQLASKCGKPVWLISASICIYTGQIAEALTEGTVIRRQRGVPIFLSRGSESGPFVYLFASRTITYFLGGSGAGSSRGEKEVAGLRRFGQESSSDKPFRMMLPAFDVRLMKKVKRAFVATGSVAAAAKRLDRSVVLVRKNLRMDRRLKRFGEYGTVNCPRPARGSGSSSIG